MPSLPRIPTVRNKYKLKPKDVNRLVLIDTERLEYKPFYRDETLHAYCLDDTIGSYEDIQQGNYDEYRIVFYDDDAGINANSIRCQVIRSTKEYGYSTYIFNQFYSPYEIESEIDLIFQEEFLSTLNWLLDNGICKLRE